MGSAGPNCSISASSSNVSIQSSLISRSSTAVISINTNISKTIQFQPEAVSLSTASDSDKGRFVVKVSNPDPVNLNVDLTPKPLSQNAKPASNLILTAPFIDRLNLDVSGYVGSSSPNFSKICAQDIASGLFGQDALDAFVKRRISGSSSYDYNAPLNQCDSKDLVNIQATIPSNLFCPASSTYDRSLDDQTNPIFDLQKWSNKNKCAYQQDTRTCKVSGVRYKCKLTVKFNATTQLCSSGNGFNTLPTDNPFVYQGVDRVPKFVSLIAAGKNRPISESTPNEIPGSIRSSYVQTQAYDCGVKGFPPRQYTDDQKTDIGAEFIITDSAFYAPQGSQENSLISTFCEPLIDKTNVLLGFDFDRSGVIKYYNIQGPSGQKDGISYRSILDIDSKGNPIGGYTSQVWSLVQSNPSPIEILPGNSNNSANNGGVNSTNIDFTTIDKTCNSTAASTMNPPLNYTEDYFTSSGQQRFPSWYGLNSISITTEPSIRSDLLYYYSDKACVSQTSLAAVDRLNYGTHCDPNYPLVVTEDGLGFYSPAGCDPSSNACIWKPASECSKIQNDPLWIESYSCSNGNCPGTTLQWNSGNLFKRQSLQLSPGITGSNKGTASVLAYNINSVSSSAKAGADGSSGSNNVVAPPTIKYCYNKQDLGSLISSGGDQNSPQSVTPSLTVFRVPVQAYDVKAAPTITNTIYDNTTMPSIFTRVDSTVRDWVNNNFPSN